MRRSIRLRGYDYASPGAYFVTICAEGRRCRFGEVVGESVALNDVGEMVAASLSALPERYPGVDLDEWVVMPNHIHAVVVLFNPEHGRPEGIDEGRPPAVAPPTLSAVVGRFKSWTTKQYIDGVSTHRWPRFQHRLWQRNYHDHVIRGDAELDRIRTYVAENPLKWSLDPQNPGP